MLNPGNINNARAALAEKMATNKAKFRTQFDDSALWDELAIQWGVRLPAWWVAPEPRLMRRYLRLFKITEGDYRKACGEGWTLESFAEKFPHYPLRAFVGNLLQYSSSLQKTNSILNQIN